MDGIGDIHKAEGGRMNDKDPHCIRGILIGILIGIVIGAGAVYIITEQRVDERDRLLAIGDANYRDLRIEYDRIGEELGEAESGLKRIGAGIEVCARIVSDSQVSAGTAKETLRRTIENLTRLAEAVRVLENDYNNLRRSITR